MLALTELLCQDACTSGEKKCVGNAVVACARASGGCGLACIDDPNFCLDGYCEDPGALSCQAGECCLELGAECNPTFHTCCGDQNAIGCVNWICRYW